MLTKTPRAGRVVIVDDKADIRLLLTTRLSLVPGIEIVGEATNGSEAIEITKRLMPDAMILDLYMPVMTGTEAIPILRALHPSMRILVYSAQSDRYSLEGATKPDAALIKGVELQVVVDTLLRLFAEAPGHGR